MKFLIFIIPLLTVSTPSFAKSPPYKGLSEIAEEELALDPSKPVKTTSPPLATVSVINSLDTEVNHSQWRMGLRYQKLGLSGTPEMEFIRQGNLSQSTSPLDFYSITFHQFFSPSVNTNKSWGLGLALGGGQSSAVAQSSSGRAVEDLRIQVLQAAIDLYGRWPLWKRLSVTSSLQGGIMNFTQASSNTAARFSESTLYLAPTAGLSLTLGQTFHVSLMVENRIHAKGSEITSEAHQYLFVLEKDWL